jgi:hypothetical protein
MWCRRALKIGISVLDEPAVSIFKVEGYSFTRKIKVTGLCCYMILGNNSDLNILGRKRYVFSALFDFMSNRSCKLRLASVKVQWLIHAMSQIISEFTIS